MAEKVEKLTTAEKEIEEARVENYKEIQRAIKEGEQPAPPPVVPAPLPVEELPKEPGELTDSELQAEITKLSHSMQGLKGVDNKLFNKRKERLERLVAERDDRAAEELAAKLREDADKRPKSASEKATFAAKDKEAKKAALDAEFKRKEADKVKS